MFLYCSDISPVHIRTSVTNLPYSTPTAIASPLLEDIGGLRIAFIGGAVRAPERSKSTGTS